MHSATAARLLLAAARNVGTLRSGARRKETPVHAAADAHVAKLSVAFRHAFAMGRRALGNPPSADRAAKAVASALRQTLKPTLLAALKAGGDAALGGLTLRAAEMRALKPPQKIGPINLEFDAANELAAAWAAEHAGWLIDNVSQTTRERVQEAISRAQLEGDLGQQLVDIEDAVGDEDRANVIARTESMTAANEGQRQGWDQAVEAGVLPADARRAWIATGDEGVCPICDELDGQETTLDGEYEGDGGDGPPAHPSCRCTEGIV